jgi:type VI secretion system protein ImpM
MNLIKKQPGWFGKLPCVGDFCSHNMTAELQEKLDLWLSDAMQEGLHRHGNAWMSAYFQTPVHGFVWGPDVIPQLDNQAAIGLIMPSVDKAGRPFPFLLLQALPRITFQNLGVESLTQWLQQAHVLCADALNEDWCLEKMKSESESLSTLMHESTSNRFIQVSDTESQWFRIEYDGAIQAVFQCNGLPVNSDFSTLLGLVATP